MTAAVTTAAPPRSLARRLLPLQIGVGFQGMMLWVPVEKLFMTQIGFDAAAVGVMAAAYAAVVPLLEVPSGILADRWSRSWVLVLSSIALMASSLLGGLSHGVATYVIAAMILGAYFALNSGTLDSVVYDTVVEETGSSELYETWIGRIRAVESAALVISALAGGLLAQLTSPRFTYFATVPLVALAVVGFLRFDEPQLHKSAEPERLRSHVALTFRTMTRDREVLRVLLLAAVAAMAAQAVFEFGPLWLVALAAPAVLYGPYWAALVSTLGVGGLVTSRLHLERRFIVGLVVVVPLGAALLLVWSQSLTVVIAAQVVVALALAIIGIHSSRLLHDAVPSAIRAGVSSGAGTMSWMLFLPFSLVFGWLARKQGINWSGLMLVGALALVGLLLILSIRRVHIALPGAEPAGVPAPPRELACRQLVELVADYIDGTLPVEVKAELENHLAGCDGCTEYLSQIERTIAALGRLEPTKERPR